MEAFSTGLETSCHGSLAGLGNVLKDGTSNRLQDGTTIVHRVCLFILVLLIMLSARPTTLNAQVNREGAREPGIAQPQGNRQHHNWLGRHKWLLITSAALLASSAADAVSTQNVPHHCPSCVETDPLLGKHPSPTRLWITLGAVNAGFVAMNWWAIHVGERDKEGWIKYGLPSALTGFISGTHVYATIHNNGLKEPVTNPNAAHLQLVK